jgi:hypothetical protein
MNGIHSLPGTITSAAEPNRSCICLCLKGFYDLIKKVALVVADFFMRCVNCLFPGTFAIGAKQDPKPPVPPNPPISSTSVKDPEIQPPPPPPKGPIPLHPDKLPQSSSDLESSSCPEVPPKTPAYRNVKVVLDQIKEAIQNERNWGSAVKKCDGNDIMIQGIGQKFAYFGLKNDAIEEIVRINAHSLIQEDFIEILKGIQPSQCPPVDVTLPSDFDWDVDADVDPINASGLIEPALLNDSETAQKMRLARLALIWVIANRANRSMWPDPEHPFHEIFESLNKVFPNEDDRDRYLPGDHTVDSKKDSQYLYCLRQVIGFQELTRILPLIKAFAAEKKQIRLIHPSGRYRDLVLEVNPLLNFVLWISQGYTRIYTYRSGSSVELPLKDPSSSRSYKSRTVETNELTGDKIAQGANLFWAAYQKAKVNQDERAFFEGMDKNTICFDKRVFSDLSKFLEKHIGLLDFTIEPQKMKKNLEIAIMEYFRVFTSEQCALLCLDESGLNYSDLRNEFDQGKLDKSDPRIARFFQEYFTKERFRAWLIEKDSESKNYWIKTQAVNEENWHGICQLMDSLCLGWGGNNNEYQ